MGTRAELGTLLKTLVSNVYFQPPPSVNMTYPCIVYRRNDIDIVFANNLPYRQQKRYEITVIDPNPDSTIHEEVAKLPMCSFDRFFTADNLNHDVFNLYF